MAKSKAKETMKETTNVRSKKFPRTLYKGDKEGKLSFTNKTRRDVRYNSVLVNDEEEMKAAEEMGYIDSYASILEEKAVAPKSEDKGDEEF